MSATNDVVGREFHFTQRDFEEIRSRLYSHAGIALSDYKKDMAYNRLVRRIRELGLGGFSDYFVYLEETPAEFGQFINALTTNLTSFFRENHHFEYLKNTVFPDLQKTGKRKVRIWSAGCSMGEEPYSIAITCREAVKDFSQWDIKILATDIDSKVLQTASNGVYGLERIENISKEYKPRYFRKGKGEHIGQVKVRSELRDMITFKELNLMKNWPMQGPLDVIFCRNVMIYFDKETQLKLLNRMAELLKPDGLLFVGHSESPFRLTNRFKLIGQTIYQRVY